MVEKLDPVANRLASADHPEPSIVIGWVEVRQGSEALRRRSMWCALGAWLLVTLAAVVGSLVAIKFAHDTRETFSSIIVLESGLSYEQNVVRPPLALRIVPAVLSAIAAVLLVGGITTWALGRFPGYSWTTSAIDWSNVSDAIWRLLSVGCTYPEAFQTAAKVSRCARNRHWLLQAARQVERGADQFSSGGPGDGDTAMLESLVETGDSDPSQRWWLAKEHFGDVARRRVGLLIATLPIMATLLAGLLVWLSISATLGWMWFTIGRMISGLA